MLTESEVMNNHLYLFGIHDDTQLRCWVLDCGRGWFDLIDCMLDEIEDVDINKKVYLTQVKEKYGSLRVYFVVDDSNELFDKVNDIVGKYEELSFIVCEECGASKAELRNHGWYKTLCDKCDELETESQEN